MSEERGAIEIVAREICRSQGVDPDGRATASVPQHVGRGFVLCGPTFPTWELFRVEAEAALRASANYRALAD